MAGPLAIKWAGTGGFAARQYCGGWKNPPGTSGCRTTQSDQMENAVQIAKDEPARVLRIVGALEIGVAEELHRALRDLVGGDSMPVVDLSEVDACDTAALQLLCSARKTAESEGKTFKLGGVSDPIRNASAALGLSLTGAPEDITGANPANRGNADAV